MWLLANMASTGMMLAGIALLTIILLRRSYRYYGRKKPKKTEAGAYLAKTARPTTTGRSLSTAPAEVLRWQVEMHEIARELKAEMDSKMRSLQVLVLQAREEADRLQSILDQLTSSRLEEVDCSSVTDSPAMLPVFEERRSRIYALADEGESSQGIADRTGVPIGEVELILSLRSARTC